MVEGCTPAEPWKAFQLGLDIESQWRGPGARRPLLHTLACQAPEFHSLELLYLRQGPQSNQKSETIGENNYSFCSSCGTPCCSRCTAAAALRQCPVLPLTSKDSSQGPPLKLMSSNGHPLIKANTFLPLLAVAWKLWLGHPSKWQHQHRSCLVKASHWSEIPALSALKLQHNASFLKRCSAVPKTTSPS